LRKSRRYPAKLECPKRVDDGGNAGAEKQPTRRAHIDEGKLQKPKYAPGACMKTGDSDKAGKTGYAKVPANKVAAWKDKSGLKKY